MSLETRIDNLIEAGWYVLESEFDAAAFMNWRKQALECVAALMGPEHAYTKLFQDFADQAERNSLLAAEGILSATKECASFNGVGFAAVRVTAWRRV